MYEVIKMTKHEMMLEKIKEIAKKRWNKIKQEEGQTKDDAVIYAIEVIDEIYNYFYDPTHQEYEDLKNGLY